MRESALDLLSEKFAVARFDRDAEVPEWAFASEFVSVTRTEQELSVVCHEAALMESTSGLLMLSAENTFWQTWSSL